MTLSVQPVELIVNTVLCVCVCLFDTIKLLLNWQFFVSFVGNKRGASGEGND